LQTLWIVAFAFPALAGSVVAGILWAQREKISRLKVWTAFETILILYAAFLAWFTESNLLDTLTVFSVVFVGSNLTFLFGCLEARFRYGK
jgi:hypothetical protein